ncbi:hypothetical protein [Roseibium sp.]|uniref:hypothetical protein n=1 Tax=Roseibium sp. TaxID=1936156 RepID=UPI003A96ABEE
MIARKILVFGFALTVYLGMPNLVQIASAQSSAGQLDDFAAGLDDFAPQETEKPLDELIGKLPAPSASADQPAVEAPAPQTATSAAQAPVIPDGWQTFEKNGFAVSLPQGWKVLREQDDAAAFGKDFDPNAGKGVIVSVIPMKSRMYERDFKGDRVGYVGRDGTVDRMESREMGGGIQFDQFKVGGGDKKDFGEGFMIVSPWPDADDRHTAVGVVAMNVEAAPHRAEMDQIRQTIRLVNPEAFRAAVIVPHEQAQKAETGPKTGMNGIVSFMVPDGWKVQSDAEDFLSFRTTPSYSGYLTIGTARHSDLPYGIGAEFASAPSQTSTEILGQEAVRYSGQTRDAEVMDGAAMVAGEKQLYVLTQCLPDHGPIHITLVGAPGWMAKTGFDGLLSAVALKLPADAIPCEAQGAQAGMSGASSSQGAGSATATAQTQPDPDSPWQIYANGRFGTVIDYPAGYFTMLPAPQNDDGRTFESVDGKTRVLVFGSHNFDDKSLPMLMAAQIAEGGYQAVTSSAMQGDRFEIRGTREGRSVIHVEILDHQNVVHTLDIAYDPGLTPDRVADLEEMAITFRVEDLAVTPAQSSSGQAQPSAADQSAMELAFWQAIANSEDPADFEAYLAQWPQGTFAVLARNKLNRLATPVPPVQVAPVSPPSAPSISSGPATGGWEVVEPSPRTSGVDLARSYTPQRGSAERKALMDAARVPIGNELGQRVIFVVSVLRTDGNWAYLQGTPVQPNGKPLNWLRTPFAADWRADVMSDVVMVLMRKSGSSWQVMDYVIGPTDVHWYGWLDVYGLPEAFFMP